MKVLVVHNRYRSFTPSGENVVVDADVAALESRGVEVVTYIRASDEIESWSLTKKASLGMLPIYSPGALRDIRRLIDRERPDLMHLHNPYPLVSPAVVRTAVNAGVPVVQTVHNHRHVCVKGIYFRDGHVCMDCLGKAIPWPAVVHGCYQDSSLRSIPMAASQVVHRGTWQRVDRYLALTPQMRDHLLSAGIPDHRITVRPNTVTDPGDAHIEGGSGVLFAGRFSEEKGIALLADAWRRHPLHSLGSLTIAGHGPLQHVVDRLVADRADVRFVGQLDAAAMADAMRAAAVLVLPSTCPEAFPRVVVEALAHGRPVIATALGGLPGIITDGIGVLVPPDVNGLDAGLAQVGGLDTPQVRATARRRYEDFYSPDVVYAQLLDIYADVLGRRRAPDPMSRNDA